jgi:hypothetical protein
LAALNRLSRYFCAGSSLLAIRGRLVAVGVEINDDELTHLELLKVVEIAGRREGAITSAVCDLWGEHGI